MPRTVFVGDVHGCADELEMLLERVDLRTADRLVLVGDLIGRGPEPRRVLDLCLRAGARAVQGNHEHRLLQWRDAPGHTRVSRSLRSVVEDPRQQLNERHWIWLDSLPLWLALPEHDVLVVHAGVCRGKRVEDHAPEVLLTMRCVKADGQPDPRRGGTLWGTRYAGPPHVVFGHNASASEPQLHPWATGLDTGCVYGGQLTAMVLAAGAPVPPLDLRRSTLVSVQARHAYVPIDEQD